MKRFLLHTLLILAPLLMLGQTMVPVKLQWQEMETIQTTWGNINYYTFDGNTNLQQYGSLPVYSTEVKLPADYFECKPEIKILDADTLSVEESLQLSDADLLSGHVIIDKESQGIRATLNVLPMFRIETADGFRVIRLIRFNVLIDFVPTEPERVKSSSPADYATTSVLSSGNWFRMGIVKTGVHKLTYDDLVEMGIDPAQVDPEKIGIFGNYKGMLPEANNKAVQDDLLENSIVVTGEQDGRFDREDYILFYASSAPTWKYNIFTGRFDHTLNLYADTVYYFFTPDMGTHKRIAVEENLSQGPTETVNSFNDYQSHEEDLENLISSGRVWYGERFTGDTTERVFTFTFPNLRKDRPVYLNVEMLARAFVNTYFEVYANQKRVLDSVVIDKVGSSNPTYARSVNRKTTFFVIDEKVKVKIRYYAEDPTSIGWLNFIVMNAERELIYQGGQMGFRDPHVTAAGNITRFNVRGNVQNTTVWDVSDIHNPRNVQYEITNDTLHYTLPTDSLKNFILFNDSEFYTPVEYLPVPNQNLHGISNVNFIIISPDVFLQQAQRLASYHRTHDGLQTVVVTPQQIYNEFSSGSQDISAIRNFIRMFWKSDAFGNQPGYLLLFGDASFDYKHRVPENTNFVPTYESLNSLRETQSFVTDDYFGLLDDDEGSNASGELDIGIGRFPVTTPEEAKSLVDKVEHYMTNSTEVMGDWRTKLCFVANDGDKNLHFKQANNLISIADTLHAGININKIFSDAFQKITVPGGKRFPEVNEKIKKQVEDGALIVNYTGHGGLIGWSDELILDVPTIRSFDNINNMPLFITATCEFSRFDNPEFVSAGENVILNQNGGGVGLLTTTRLAYAHANIVVNMRVYNNLLKREDGKRPRLGDIVRLSKIPSNTNFLNFALLGDPALMLAYPKYDVVTTKLTNKSTGVAADTVHALSLVTVSGKVVDENGTKLNNFNGYVYPKVFDKPSVYKTLGNDNDSYPAEFTLSDKILYSGKSSVVNGEFQFTFLVPHDIAYNYGLGKISYYALDTTQFADAWGDHELLIGGYENGSGDDETGPDISLFMDNKNFETGGTTSQSPLFIADLSDDQGINFTGHSLGRDITLIMDNDISNTMVLNDYFNLDVDSYTSGHLSYQFHNLKTGWHSLTLKAWDLENNSSEKTIEFYADESAQIKLTDVMCYPNPFTEETYFSFVSNKNGTPFDVTIHIFDMNGRPVHSLNSKVDAESNTPAKIVWNGLDDNGAAVPAGFYTYLVIVTDRFGNQAVQRQKLIKF